MQDRFLCVSDEQYDDAVALSKSQNDILAAVPPSPVKDRLRLRHMFPRFKLIGTTDFWVIHPSSYLHVSCKPQSIEKSLNGLPYPKLPTYVEALLDTQNGVDLADLIDAADLSEEWGEENIKLDQDIDTAWAKQQNDMQCQTYGTMRYALSEVPEPRRALWTRLVCRKSPA